MFQVCWMGANLGLTDSNYYVYLIVGLRHASASGRGGQLRNFSIDVEFF